MIDKGQLFFLEELRAKQLPRIVTLIQSGWRGYKARKAFRQLKASIEIQRRWKGYKARKEWLKNKDILKKEIELQRRKQAAAAKLVVKLRRFMVTITLKLCSLYSSANGC
jgi:myosin heavy subunit